MANPNRLNSNNHLSSKNRFKIGLSAISAIALGLASCAPSAKDVARELATIQASAAIGTPIPPYLDTPTPETTTMTCDLFRYFAQDIVNSIPGLNVDQIGTELSSIASKIPADVPFDSKGCYGLIPNPATGQVIAEEGPINWNSPEGGFGYLSTGNVNVKFGESQYNLPYIKNNVHLVFAVGKADNHAPDDLNTTLDLSQYPAGHMYANLASPQQGGNYQNREVIDQAWFAQQLWWASQSGSNCGVGCESTITVSFIDVETGGIKIYEVNPSTFDWTETNYDQMKSRSGQSSTDQLKQVTGGNPSRITSALNPKAARNPFKGVRT